MPSIYGALVYLQLLDGGWYADGGVYSLVEAMARGVEVRCDAPVERIEQRSGRVTGVALRGGERVPADVVVSNADVLRAHALARAGPRRGGACGRRCAASCSTSARTACSSACCTTRCSSARAIATSSAP